MERLFPWCFASVVYNVFAGELRSKMEDIRQHFDPLAPPSHVTDIGVGIYFDHLYDVDDRLNRFTADFYLSYQWKDPRWATVNWQEHLIQHNLTETDVGSCRRPGSSAHSNFHSTCESSLQHFLELGHDEIDLIWIPDLHIRNQHTDEMRVNSEMIRVYIDGTVEVVMFIWAILNLQDPDYTMFPYDSQDLAIIIESLSHTNKRIILHPLHDLTGLEESLTYQWPGWSYKSYEEFAYNIHPEYFYTNPARIEEKCRVKFVIHVSRHFQTISMLPMILLVVASWSGSFIKLQALMPRIGTGFISFLTLNNIAQSQLTRIPPVNYAVWYANLIDLCRYSAVMSVLQTVVAQFICDQTSTRVALWLDRCARIVIPVYFLAFLALMLIVKDTDSISTIQIVVKINLFLVIVITAICTILRRHLLISSLHKDPLRVYGDGTLPLDTNECGFVFHAIAHDETSNSIDVPQIVDWFSSRPPISLDERLKGQSHLYQKALEETVGTSHMPIEGFRKHQRAIFAELRLFITGEKRKQSMNSEVVLDRQEWSAEQEHMPNREETRETGYDEADF